MPTARSAALDALRVFALFGVVTLHAAGGGFSGMRAVGFVLDELSRFAVPAFFILSGWFWRPALLATPLRLIGRIAWRILPAFALWFAIYFLRQMLNNPDWLAAREPRQFTEMLWTGGPGFHLWYLPALVMGTVLVVLSLRWLGDRLTVALALLLYLAGCLMGAYGFLLPGGGVDIHWYRNGIFFAPVFLLLGGLLRRHEKQLQRLPLPALLALLGSGALLQLAEGYFVVGHYPMGHDYSLATLFYAPAVLVLFLRLPLNSPLWSQLGAATFMAYLVHPMVLGWLVMDAGLGSTNTLPVIVLCFGLSLALALLWRNAWSVVTGGWHQAPAPAPAR